MLSLQGFISFTRDSVERDGNNVDVLRGYWVLRERQILQYRNTE